MKQKSKYAEPKRVKVGRILYVCDFDGKPLVGLSWDSGNGQYYYSNYRGEKDYKTGKNTRKEYSFGVHYQEAVFSFKQWITGKQKFSISIPTEETVEIEEIISDIPAIQKHKIQNLLKPIVLNGKVDIQKADLKTLKDILQSLVPYVSQVISTDKKYALHILKQILQDEELRIEAIRLLKLEELLPKKYRILSFKEVYEFYKETNDCSDKEKRLVRKAVEHFTQITKEKNINDIIEDDILYFKDYILSLKKSPVFVNGRFSRIKTVLNYYNTSKQGNGEKELVRKVLDYCKALSKVSSKVMDPPKSFDVKTVKSIFSAAEKDKELLLMFLLMLNTGYYPTDIRNLKKSMIKEKDGLFYIIFSRKKTGELFKRVNCLWDITAELLKEQCEKCPDSAFVFLTETKSQYAESTLGKKFTSFFKELTGEEKPSISAKNFRDTVASNLAFDVSNINILKLTLGHSIQSVKDEFWKYVDSRPEQQKQAADILYKKFRKAIESIKK